MDINGMINHMRNNGVDIESLQNGRALVESHNAREARRLNITDRFDTLTPAALMMMLRIRLGDLDEQINGAMGEIEDNTRNSEEIQEKLAALNAVESALGDIGDDDNMRLNEIEVTFQGRTYTADELIEEYGIEEFRVGSDSLIQDGNVDGDTRITRQHVTAAKEALQSKARRINSKNEMLMVQLQSSMQQRTQIITMTTQALSALNEGMKSISQNIGR